MTRPKVLALLLAGGAGFIVLVASAIVFGPGWGSLRDTLILGNGTQTGALASCDAAACILDGNVVSRALIRWIGLQAPDLPPDVEGSAFDEVFLADGSVKPGPLLSVSAEDVETASARFPRPAVRWIRLAHTANGVGGSSLPSGSATPAPAGSFVWEGTIRVESRFADETRGRHHWKARYRVKLLEIGGGDPSPSPKGRPTANRPLEPLELRYELEADQSHQQWPQTDVMQTIVMRGSASGELRGDDLSFFSRGSVWELYETEPPLARPASFASVAEAMDFGRDIHTEPGWYSFTVEFPAEEAKRRALYRGIDLSGSWWDERPITDASYLASIPPTMPTPTRIYGRLESPDQAKVRGAFTYDYRSGDDMSETPHQISVEWELTRTRQ